MKKIIKFIVQVSFHILLLFALTLGTTLLGGIIGWVVGLFFGETILNILACIGIKGFSMFQIGLFLGFVSCYFKTLIKYKKNSKSIHIP